MHSRPDEPEKAIRAFEAIHRLHITVHDFSGSLRSRLHHERAMHSHPFCRCVKSAGGARKCEEFELIRLRADLQRWPEGRFHVCHAGWVEWVLPVYRDLRLEWILFAGVRSPGKDFSPHHRERPTRWARTPWKEDIAMPESIGQDEAEMILEHLRQLASRLQSWVLAHRADKPAKKDFIPYAEDPRLTQKRVLIRRFIESRQWSNPRLKDLARRLGVGEDRATHLIRECCGESFRNMLVEARLKTARELLRFSSLPILEVALNSGFNEITHFNRLFRKRVGMTPRKFRAAAVKQ